MRNSSMIYARQSRLGLRRGAVVVQALKHQKVSCVSRAIQVLPAATGRTIDRSSSARGPYAAGHCAQGPSPRSSRSQTWMAPTVASRASKSTLL